MTSKSPKPIKQCQGCGLNLGERCAAFEHPIEKWLKRDCEGFNDPELLKKFGLNNNADGAHKRKLERQEKAKQLHTIEHEEGRTKQGKKGRY